MKIQVEITGTTPLILNRFSDEEAMNASSGSSAGAGAPDRGQPEEICKKKLYTDESGKICVPQPNLLRCLVDGGSFHKAGRKQITTAKSSLLYAGLDIEGTMIPIISKGSWSVDTRPVRIPATGGRILRHRPIFHDWKLKFILDLDTEMINPKLLRLIVDDSGKKIGLGDFRPSTKGPFGKFVVILWKEETVKLPQKEAA